MSSSSSRSRNLIVACGVLGPLMLGAYFTAPLFATQLGGVLYAAHSTTVQVVDVGRRYLIRVFPIVPAPALYLSVGALLVGSTALPRAFGRLALILGAAFALTGFIGVFLPAASAVTAGLSGLQILWIIAAAITLDGRIHRKRGQRLRPEPAYEQH